MALKTAVLWEIPLEEMGALLHSDYLYTLRTNSPVQCRIVVTLTQGESHAHTSTDTSGATESIDSESVSMKYMMRKSQTFAEIICHKIKTKAL